MCVCVYACVCTLADTSVQGGEQATAMGRGARGGSNTKRNLVAKQS